MLPEVTITYSEKELEKINLDFILNKIRNSNILDYYKIQIKSENFDKDGLNNSHLYFIHSSSVLRARNHNIPEEDKNKTHLIAGNIIPIKAPPAAYFIGRKGKVNKVITPLLLLFIFVVFLFSSVLLNTLFVI